jgi:uncharacterized UBP type Zn finger protein
MSNELIIPPLGFMNTASICYFNSLIQSLLSCSSFLSFICKDQQDSIFYLFFKFIVFEQKWDPYFTTKLLHSMNTFEPNQSSSEYFLKLCDFFKMDDLFQTKTETLTICNKCHHENKIVDISVYIMIDNDINECIETKRTIENYQCDLCKEKVNATIISRLTETSEIIIFTFNKYFQKNNIEYPLEFRNYKLLSTIEHHGVLNAGHYFCRSVRNNSIFQFDDNNVQPISSFEPTPNTYMIFYQKI